MPAANDSSRSEIPANTKYWLSGIAKPAQGEFLEDYQCYKVVPPVPCLAATRSDPSRQTGERFASRRIPLKPGSCQAASAPRLSSRIRYTRASTHPAPRFAPGLEPVAE